MSSEETDQTTISTEILGVLKKTEDLQHALASLTSTNSSLRFYCQKLMTRLNEFTCDFGKVPQETCNICFEADKTHALDCGHCFCLACCTKCLGRRACFVCNQEPDRSIRVFL